MDIHEMSFAQEYVQKEKRCIELVLAGNLTVEQTGRNDIPSFDFLTHPGGTKTECGLFLLSSPIPMCVFGVFLLSFSQN